MPISVGVAGGLFECGSASKSCAFRSSGRTGPGRTLYGFASGDASSKDVARTLTECNPSTPRCTILAWGIILLRLCVSAEYSLALYNVSTPSGRITISAVPTRTPIPMVDIRRNLDCERVNDRGSDPAMKDLSHRSAQFQKIQRHLLTQWP